MRNISINICIIFFLLIFKINAYTLADAISQNGMVVSSKSHASKIGIDILEKGGNAIDAAIAVGFSLAVTHPSAGNIGGGGFMIIRFANGDVTTIDFREVAPMQSSKNMYLDEEGNVVQGKSWSTSLATGTPGTVAGLGYIHEKYATLPWETLIYPSIILAKFGFELDYFNISILNSVKF